MPVDYQDAAARHFHDAELLYGQGRLANADHLYGMAAECGFKAIMKSLGAPMSSRGNPLERSHKAHINELWDEFVAFVGGRGGARYIYRLPIESPFTDWDISQRYYPQIHFKKSRVDSHRGSAKDVIRLLEQALLDGVL